ncbi:MAG: ammonium transporter [Phormidesmis sp.]
MLVSELGSSPLQPTKTLLDLAWLTLCGILVFIMQAGFLCLEAGSTRSKNRINIVIKNISDLGLSVIAFWAVGYGLMFGFSWQGAIGFNHFFPNSTQATALWTGSFFLFQAMFCSTAVTILSGAAAERIRFKVYLVITILISGIIYPVFGHWVWNGLKQGMASGWLAQNGFVDFAGTTVVHSLGGWCALAAVLMIGPRMGRFSRKRHFEESASADLPFAFLGTMLLWFGWFGFNGGSNLAFNQQVAVITINTLMAGAAGLITPIAIMEWQRQPIKTKPVLNGALAGLVAVTGGCHVFSTGNALLVGAIGSILMLIASKCMERYKIDDVVDAIPVHLVAGIWGTLAVGLFGDLSQLGTGLNRFLQIKAQVAGITACGLWAFPTTLLGLLIIQQFTDLRVSTRQEYVGLNISEHGATSDVQDVYSVMKYHAETGNLNRKVHVDPFTEVGQVGQWYNQVVVALESAVASNDAIIKTAVNGIITVTQRDLIIRSANPSTSELFGYEHDQLIDTSFQRLIDQTSAQLSSVLVAIAQEETPREMSARYCNGHVFPIQVTATSTNIRNEDVFVIFLQDISERKRTEKALIDSRTEANCKALELEQAMTQLKRTAQLIQTERVAGQHQLVSGIAHEINNPVGFIHSNLDHARRYVESLLLAFEAYQAHSNEISQESRSHLEEELDDLEIDYIVADFPKLLTSMKTGTERIRAIVKQLRTFSCHDEAELKTVDLHVNIESTLVLINHRLQSTDHRPAITVRRHYDDIPQVECYVSALNQAILKILTNAIEAFDRDMADGDLTASLVQQKTPYIAIHTRQQDANIILSIVNNGPPIAEADQKRIFDPFFTTQPVGMGTGLGCTLSHQIIVEHHHGRLSCHSAPGSETSFVIEIPIQQTAYLQ